MFQQKLYPVPLTKRPPSIPYIDDDDELESMNILIDCSR